MPVIPGGIWVEGNKLHYVDENGVRRTLVEAETGKSPVNSLIATGVAVTQLKRPVSRRSLFFPWRK